MKACDEHAIRELGIPSRTLMQRAAEACVSELDGFDLARTYILCGAGNNGGDGMAVAAILASRGVDVTVVFAGDEAHLTSESAFRLERLRDLAVPVVGCSELADATAIVDALFGVGLTRAVEGKAAQLIDAANISPAPILSIDVPSGLFADSAAVAGTAICARRTVAIQNLKPCHVLYGAAEKCGEIRLADIGISDSMIPESGTLLYATEADAARLSPRPAHSHKGTFGRLLVIAGSAGMAGAAYFSALAAYRTGAGLVEIFTVEDNLLALQSLIPEAIITTYNRDNFAELLDGALERASAAVCGPGLGRAELSRSVVRRVLAHCDVPLVLDADALNITADENLEFPHQAEVVITPHLGEMSRLVNKSIGEISAAIVDTAREFAASRGVVCVLKDSHSIICDGAQMFVNLAGCSAMAKGGSGDVLTGIVGTLAASGVGMSESAVLGCFLHGRAGERAAQKHGLHGVLARDIANEIRR